MPAVNQIEVHPYFTNDEVRAYGIEHDIATQSLVTDRPRQGPRRPGGDPHHKGLRRSPGPGRAALAYPARRHRLPETVHPQRMKDNFGDLRLRPRRRGDRGADGTGQGRAGPDGAQSRHVRLHPGLSTAVECALRGGRTPEDRALSAQSTAPCPRLGQRRLQSARAVLASPRTSARCGSRVRRRRCRAGTGRAATVWRWCAGLGVLHEQRPLV